MAGALASGTRCAALIGPYLSGKTTLMESLLFATGAVPRKGSVKEGNTVGDSAPESRARQNSVSLILSFWVTIGPLSTVLDRWNSPKNRITHCWQPMWRL